MNNVKNLFLDTIGLRNPRGRILFAAIVHIILLLVPYTWLTNLSLYKLIGLTQAPSIGLTRAYWNLLHGNIVGAWEMNWLIFPVLAVGWSIVALDVKNLIRRTKSSAVLQPQDQ